MKTFTLRALGSTCVFLIALDGAAEEAPPTDDADAAAPTPPESDTSLERCIADHEHAQVLRAEGRLQQARARLISCSSDKCPDVVRSDCAKWYTDIGAQVPSIVLSARKGDRDVFSARVSLNGALLTDSLDGHEIELDPGRYKILVELPDGARKEKEVLVGKGQRARRIEFVFEPAVPALPPVVPIMEDEPPPTHRPMPWGTLVLGGASLLGVGIGTGFGVEAIRQRNELRRECSPYCTDDEKAKVDALIMTSDIGFAVGILAGIGGVVTYLLRPEIPLDQGRRTAGMVSPLTGWVPTLSGSWTEAEVSLTWQGKY